MSPTILPHYELSFQRAGADAEQGTLNFLKALPERYFVLRELRTLPTIEKQRTGSTENRVDLVVIGHEIGVIALEVKDWNIQRNTYEWLDQYTVQKTSVSGQVERFRSPFAQVDEYRWAINDILKSQLPQQSVRVNGFVVYPKLTRAEFENAFTRGKGQTKPGIQEKYILDQTLLIFRDDLAQNWEDPCKLFVRLVGSQVKMPYANAQIEQTVNVLVPSKLRVGDPSRHNQGYENLLLMDIDQQKWAFTEIVEKNYLLDVAGSGKTNIILSRAMHLAHQHQGVPDFRILVLTYNEALVKDLKRLRNNKIKDQKSSDMEMYRSAIHITDIKTVMEQIIDTALGKIEADTWRRQVQSSLLSLEDYLEYKLPEKCQDILDEDEARFRWYDYLLVDEVQDFSDFFLDIALSLLKLRNCVFMVGDAGQKLFDRKHSLSELGMSEERARIRSHERMYRSPRLIGQLAWAFLCHDLFITYELKEQGYAEHIKSKNTLLTQPVFKRCMTREALLKEVCDDIENLTFARARHEQVLCIGLTESLDVLYSLLNKQAIPTCWANEISDEDHRVVLANFADAKGLERDYVFILDIDRLPDGTPAEDQLFVSIQMLEEEGRRSRIKIFIALTRALREVYLYYTHQQRRFVHELLELKQPGGEKR